MAATWKTVRVFISSTFRDMHAERDHLVKVTFPRLRQWCEERRLHLVDIDLRWGVTEAEANNGKAIEFCLKEIDGSRPFFVCILGGRYGWVPDRLPPEERYRFRGLQDVTHRSITHLEILHATDQPIATVDGQRGEVCPHAFFYLRKEGCIPPVELLAHLRDAQRQRHTETYFEHDRPQDLVELKLWIRSKFEKTGQVHDYDGEWDRTAENPEDAREKPEERLVGRLANLDTFGALVYADLERAISLQFAEHIAQVPSATERPSEERLLDDERAAHETFIENRTQIHVPRAEVEQTLNAYVWDNDHRPVVLSGPPGSGKSAVLAHWVRTRLESGEFVTPGDTAFPHQTAPRADAPLVLARFVGASPSSTNLARLLSNICEELRRRFDLQEEVEGPASPSSTQTVKRIQPMQVPADPNDVLRKWPKFLTAASGRGPVVIVLDAINQLDRTTDASRLYWLPRELPPGIKLIISVLDHGPRSLADASFNRDPTGSASVNRDPTGSASAEPPDWLSVLRRMQFREIPVPALNPTEQERIIRDLPNVFCKTLETKFVEQLLTNRATTNPLFLTVALEELRTFGSFERLPERILQLPEWREPSGDGDPMDAALDAMFGQVLDRLERESRKQARGLVPCVFGSLASAKQGLSESELQGLLARQMPHIPARVRDGELQIVLRQVRPYLMRKAHFQGALLDFFHRSFWKAVREKYLTTDEQQSAAHARLAAYFKGQDYFLESLDEQRARAKRLPPTPRPANIRKVDELPWQRFKEAQLSGKWDEVGALLTDLLFLEAKSEAGLAFDLAGDLSQGADAMPQDHPQNRTVRILDKALRRDIHFIARHRNDYPQALFQCLWNSCLRSDSEQTPGVDINRNNASADQRGASDLEALLDSWRQLKPANTIWCEGLLPPVIQPEYGPDCVLEGHNGFVWRPVFSPDGLRIATSGCWDGRICVWDVATGECLRMLATGGNIGPAAWCPDSRRLVVKPAEDKLIVWNWYHDSIETVIDLPISEVDLGGIGIAVSPDAKYVAVSYRCGLLLLCDLGDGSVLSEVRISQRPVFLVEFTCDGTSLAVASHDSPIRFLAVPSLADQHSTQINNLSWCTILPDGNVLAVCEIVPGKVGSHVTLYDGTTGAVRTVVNDGSSGQYAEPQFVACSGSGRRVAFNHERGVTMMDLDQNTRVTIPIRFGSSGFPSLSVDGRFLALTDLDQVMIWRMESVRPLMIRRHEWEVREAAPSPCGRFIAVATESAFKGSLNDSPLVVLDTASGAPVCEWRRRESRASAFDSIAWFNRSCRVAFAGRRGPLWIWGPASEHDVCKYDLRAICLKILISSDDAWIGCACQDGTVRLIALACDEPKLTTLATSEGPELAAGADTPLAFSQDTHHLAAAIDRSTYVDEMRIPAEENAIYVWELARLARPVILSGHSDAVTCLAFDPANRLLASGSRNKEVKIWELATGRVIHDLTGHEESVDAVRFTDDGKWVVASAEGKPRTYLWHMPTGKLSQHWAGGFNVQDFGARYPQLRAETLLQIGYHLGHEYQIVNLSDMTVLAAIPTHYNDSLAFLPLTERLVRWNFGLLELYRLPLRGEQDHE